MKRAIISAIVWRSLLFAVLGLFPICAQAEEAGPIDRVDFIDFALFANNWLRTDCNQANNWCNGADLNGDEEVTIADLAEIANYWLLDDPFVGTRTIMLYGDDSISDGVIIDSLEVTTITSRYNMRDYAIEIVTGPMFSMARDGESQLALSPQPQDMGTWIAANVYMLSDGVNGAFLIIGKDPGQLDISPRVATWAREVEVSGSQLEGQWLIKWINDDNLRDAYLEPFSFEEEILTITDMGNGQVNVQTSQFDAVMNINGNSLEPVVPIDPSLVHFSMVTDGQGISVAAIGVETWDSTDVSASIGLAARVP